MWINSSSKSNKKTPSNKNYYCEGGLHSHDNEIEVLIRQLKREVKELLQSAQAKLLCQDKKITENVQLGKYIINSHLRVDDLRNNLKLVISSTVALSDLIKLYGGNYNGIYSGVKYYTYSASDMTSNI